MVESNKINSLDLVDTVTMLKWSYILEIISFLTMLICSLKKESFNMVGYVENSLINFRVKIYIEGIKMSYLEKVLSLGLKCQRGEIVDVYVFHDDDCEIFEDGECNCNPDIKKISRAKIQKGSKRSGNEQSK